MNKINTYPKLTIVLSILLHCALVPSIRAAYSDGDIAEDFTIANRLQGGALSLSDYAGHVIVLDFFAYWCGPCQTSSPELESEVAEYYQQLGGNPNGVPVTVISVNIENGNEPQTDLFIQNAGLTLVANDYDQLAWNTYSMGYIPHFVVINGVARSPSHAQWEIIHTNYGYRGAQFYRDLIDSVEAPSHFDLEGWTVTDQYPYVYSVKHGWLYFQPSDGGLWIHKYDTGQWILKN